MFNATRFKTLMLREWLQNRWTWLVATAALPALVLVVLPFGEVQLPDKLPVTLVAVAMVCITALTTAAMAWLTTLFMATGLARRDVQDRSIEFWLSLPSTHGEHFGAQYAMHGLLMPLGAMVLGLGLGFVITPLMLLKWQGWAALGAVDWTVVLGHVALQVALSSVALLALALWLAPVVFTLMAASAWVKRLALPLLVVASALLANLPQTAVHVRAFVGRWAELAATPVDGVVRVFATQNVPHAKLDGSDLQPMLPMEFLGELARDLATPQFAFGLALTALAVYLLIIKRRSNG
jgi:hypothetical protein